MINNITMLSCIISQDEAKEQGNTECSRRSHKAYFDIGHKTYIFRYRACFNRRLIHIISCTQLLLCAIILVLDVHNALCYDSREALPPYCPWFFRGEDCVEIEWKIHGFTKRFEICDKCKNAITNETNVTCSKSNVATTHTEALPYNTLVMTHWHQLYSQSL